MALVFAALLGLLALYALANTAISAGSYLEPRLGLFGFLGTFVNDLGEMLVLFVFPASALVGGFVLMNLAGRLGQWAIEHLSAPAIKTLNVIVGALAGAALFSAIGAAIEWIYQLGNLALTLWWPAALGALLGALLAVRLPARGSLAVGDVIYNLTRTITNVLRAIESLVMVIVFAVWVGIGPFAGVLALALHTVASLIKLYSEQIESIMSGPIEAIKATGATRLQTIIYAVIPQIIPPFISYTMYRWDINVRMSTIIGFAGGGGIGFLLQQNVNLLNYRDAATQMLAIAIVVILMDYLSSALRERAI
jgi:phosphonate ABC transporter permease subunit PhnE